jgi:hypothetical protein
MQLSQLRGQGLSADVCAWCSSGSSGAEVERSRSTSKHEVEVLTNAPTWEGEEQPNRNIDTAKENTLNYGL